MSGLNKAQQEAVDHKSGPALVIAGAGTGKTRVIVERINTLIDDGVKPESIVALTFTEKAAQEMSDRVNEIRGGYFFDAQIATFNGFGEQIIRRFATDIGMNSQFQVLGDVGQIVFMKQHLEALKLSYYSPITNPDGLLGELASYFSTLKQNVITPQVYKTYADALPTEVEEDRQEAERHKELAYAYKMYCSLAREANVIDYDDQIYLLVELLETKKNVRALLVKEIAYLLVDEFQDTNPMQSRLLKLLSSEKNNIMAVGDDDQSIYGFRGANIQNILSFTNEYPGTKQIVLTENYRSTQEILDDSYTLITNNNPDRLEVRNSINKKLNAQSSGGEVEVQGFSDHEDEITFITQSINQLISKGVNPGEIAVLVRRNQTALKLHDMLLAADIPHQLAGQTHDLYKEPIIQAVIDCLRTVHDPVDNQSAYHALRGPFFNLAVTEISIHAGNARREHSQLTEQLREHMPSSHAALDLIEGWRNLASELSVGQLAYRILTDTGIKDSLVSRAQEDPESAQTVMYLSQFFNQLKQYERATTHHHLSAFIDNIPLLSIAGERSNDDLSSELDNGSVSVLTIHKSKGLEWQHVFIADVVEGSLPSQNRKSSLALPEEFTAEGAEQADHVHEERRLMYVAMTRAKKNLIITYAKNHGGKREKKPSRFISEILSEAIPEEKPASSNQLHFDLFAKKASDVKRKLPDEMLQDGTLRLSVSQLNDYIRCPSDFYYRHILKVPQESAAGLEYGSIMHAMIERYTRARAANQSISADALIEELISSWPKVGFISKEHRERAQKQAVESLKRFIAREDHIERQPTMIEQPFQILIDQTRIAGRFDAVYDDSQGVEVRDYKSGTSASTPEKAKRRAQSSDQLTQYALAWQQLHDEIPDVLSLDFFDTGQIGSVKKTQRGIDTMTQKIKVSSAAIRAFEFPKGRDHSFCQHP